MINFVSNNFGGLVEQPINTVVDQLTEIFNNLWNTFENMRLWLDQQPIQETLEQGANPNALLKRKFVRWDPEVLTCSTSGEQEITPLKDGFPLPIGELRYSDGSVYYGKHINETPYGWGKMTYSNGTQFIGEFKDGVQNGWGMLCTPDGQIIGENNRCIGELRYLDGTVYYGKHSNEIPEGWGIMTYRNDTKFIGEFKDGEPNGWGMLCTFDEKIIEEGQWVNGNRVP